MAIAVSGMVGGLLVAAPASAGARWSDPQQVDSRYGWQVSLSDDGETAAWIRTVNFRQWGPVRTARYRGEKKDWSRSKQISGSAETEEVVLSGDGRSLLIKAPTSYSVTTRKSGNRWSALETVAEAKQLGGGRMSADGRTVIWVDESGLLEEAFRPSRVMSRTRSDGGSWGPAVEIGEFFDSSDFVYEDNEALAWDDNNILTRIDLARDGSTAVWMDSVARFVGSERAADGTWAPPKVIQTFAADVVVTPIVRDLQVSADGSRVIWRGADGVLTTTRRPTGWAAVQPVTRGGVSSVALSPDGTVVAYGLYRSGRVEVRQLKSGRWSKPKKLGTARYPHLVVRTKAVAWSGDDLRSSRVRVSLQRKGEWTKPTAVAKKAYRPSLSAKADVLAWADRRSRDILGIRR